MLYFDDILVQDIDEEEQRRRNNERRLKTMQFERPWLIKRLTNTYYRKSKQDYVQFELKVKKLRKQFQSRANRMSVNLEQIMYKKQGKDNFLENESSVPDQTGANLMEDQSRVHLNKGNYNSSKLEEAPPHRAELKIHKIPIVPFSPHSTTPLRFQHEKTESESVTPRSKIESNERQSALQSGRSQQPHRIKKLGASSAESDPRNGLPIGLDSKTKNCLICFNSWADAVLLNCGHGGICYECGRELLLSTQVCHLCRQNFSKVVQLDLNSTTFNYINVIAMTYFEGEEETIEEEQSTLAREDLDEEESKHDGINPVEIEESKEVEQETPTQFITHREAPQLHWTPIDLVSYKSEERNYDSYLESTLRSKKKSSDKRGYGSEFTTERQMLDAIRQAQTPVAPEIVPYFNAQVSKIERSDTSPYTSAKLPRRKNQKLRVMSIVMKNQGDNSILTSLTVSQRLSRMNSGEVVWDSTDKKLYLASLGAHDLIQEKEVVEQGHPQGYPEGGMIKVEENEYEGTLDQERGNRRVHNLGGVLRSINKD